MANKTIGALPLETVAAPEDWIEGEKAVGGGSYRISKANWMGGYMSGGGGVVTNGFTLTVPANGIAALRNVAQTFTGLQTFSNGISFGGNTLANYDATAFTPELWDAATGGNKAAISTAGASYTRIGNRVFMDISLIFINTAGLTPANTIYIRNLPFTRTGTSNDRSVGECHAVSAPFTSGYLNAFIAGTTNYLTIRKTVSGGVATNLLVSELTVNLAQLMISICYPV